MNAVATPASARPTSSKIKTAPAAAKPVVVATRDYSPAEIKAVFQQLEVLLNEAYTTDEDHGWSADSDRLISIAHDLADQAEMHPPSGNAIDEVAFNIAALIRAARLVPGDEESPQRKALIDQAAVHLNWLTECDMGGEDCCDPGVPRPAAPVRDTPQSLPGIASAPATTESFASTAWYRACEARQVVHACVESYGAPETIWAVHTVMNAACQTLSDMVTDEKVTADGCEDASNFLAQSVALTSMITETVNGESWELLLDAALALMVMAKDTLDCGREALDHA